MLKNITSIVLCSRFKFFLFSISVLLPSWILQSCEVVNPDEEIPSYIHIENIKLNVDEATEGTSSHNIVDAWIFVNDKSIGAYELPATIPILAKGKQTLKIGAGIKNNGIGNSRVIYPFYELYTKEIELHPDSVITVEPQVSYFSNTVFSWIEEFEDVSVSINEASNSKTKLSRTDNFDEVLEGSFSGKILLDADGNFYKGISNEVFELPTDGSSVYLELNYSTSCEFIIKVQVNPQQVEQRVLFINPTTVPGNINWNKIYVDLTPVTSTYFNARNFNIIIEASKKNSVDQIYFDNIKLLHK